jgi:site-specific recombinase XerD
VVGYVVHLGIGPDGRRIRRFFPRHGDAEKFLRSQPTDPKSIGELIDRKAELLYALEQIRPHHVTLPEVITFYLRNHTTTTDPTLGVLIDLFLTEKRRIGRSHHYERSIRYYLDRFADHVGRDVRISTITKEVITNYVYHAKKDVGLVTKRNLLNHVSVLFSFAVKEDLLRINPVTKIARPTVPFRKPHVLTPADFGKLLHRCLDRGWGDRLVVFVLVGFCGIRVEEACRLSWSHLRLEKSIVEVPAEFAKKARFRNNRIPPNALAWIKKVEDRRRKGPLIGPNWRNLLRSAVRFTHIDYRQNCIRHSFCSYALVSGWSLADVIAAMGHGGSSPAIIFTHYRNVVSEEDGKRWFGIVP